MSKEEETDDEETLSDIHDRQYRESHRRAAFDAVLQALKDLDPRDRIMVLSSVTSFYGFTGSTQIRDTKMG